MQIDDDTFRLGVSSSDAKEAKLQIMFGEADDEMWPRVYESLTVSLLGDEGDLVKGYSEIIGGCGTEGLKALTGVEAQAVDSDGLVIDELTELHDSGLVAPVSQKYIPGSGWGGIGRETGEYKVNDDLHTRHVYWIEEVNVGTDDEPGSVVIRNPWGYNDERIEMTIEEFNEAFREVDLVTTE